MKPIRVWLKPFKTLLLVAFLLSFVIRLPHAQSIRIGIAQTTIENTLSKNLDKILEFISMARDSGCSLVIFPESSLYYHPISVDSATKVQIDQAIEKIRAKINAENIHAVIATQYQDDRTSPFYNKVFLINPEGDIVVEYTKNFDVPRAFSIDGIKMNLVLCSDRWYIEHSDLPAVADQSRVILDVSGGHGGDDGRPDMRWIRYRPWAIRTNAFVVVTNPPHGETDFMGHQPYGGGSAVIRPDGSIQASLFQEEDVLMVEEVNIGGAHENKRSNRKEHPLLKPFWEAGEALLVENKSLDLQEIEPYTSEEAEVSIAAIQMECSGSLEENVKTIINNIGQAARDDADIAVFPELALSGQESQQILSLNQGDLERALIKISAAVRKHKIYAIVGTPFADGEQRTNSAIVFGPDGDVLTRYDQLNVKRTDLFSQGLSTIAMWFQINGVYAIVTIGEDSEWIELPDLASLRGMVIHFHITNEPAQSEEHALLRKEKNIDFLKYASYGTVVNAANRSKSSLNEDALYGGSMIVSREGGHNKPAPEGLEDYLPYQTSVAKSAGTEEEVLFATRKVSYVYPRGIIHSYRMGNRQKRDQAGWDDWINLGLQLIEMEISQGVTLKPSFKVN